MNTERKRVLGALLLAATLMVGIGVRLPGVTRGLVTNSWREADVAAIARNFAREGMDPLYPRVDWRGDGPGFAEMEFPFLPWATACLYDVFGVHLALGRLLSLSASLLTLVLFAALARRLLPVAGAIAASAFFALNPLSIWLASALQSEPFMMAGLIASVLLLHRWLAGQRETDYWLALGALSIALLAKLTAIHIGLVFAFLIVERFGRDTWRQPRVWLLAIGALLPVAAWYLHAHQLWKIYGNSLGLSNEYHWLGLDLLAHPRSLLGIPRTELLWVFMRTGALLSLVGVACARSLRPFRFELFWLAATWFYYLAAARTTADSWAFYYHIASLPPFALLVGRAVSTALQGALEARATAIRPRLLRMAGAATAIALFAACLAEEAHVAARERSGRPTSSLLSCAPQFAPLIPPTALVVASGGPCIDETSKPVAFNASYAFYWLDRKGFNTCQQHQSLEALQEFERRGARYFVMEKDAAAATPGFAEAVRQDYILQAQCAEASLFELRSPTATK